MKAVDNDLLMKVVRTELEDALDHLIERINRIAERLGMVAERLGAAMSKEARPRHLNVVEPRFEDEDLPEGTTQPTGWAVLSTATFLLRFVDDSRSGLPTTQ